MSFAPIIPLDGYVGWRFLQRTMEKQQAAHAAAPSARRDVDYFRANIRSITSAAELVKDRRLLSVALTAFGLQDDLPNRFYIQKVLESSASDEGSFVNRLADKRYKQLNEAFGFGESRIARNPVTGMPLRSVATAGADPGRGLSSDPLRRSLAQGQELAALVAAPGDEATKWRLVLDTPSLRGLFQSAFNLPAGFDALSVDVQVEVLQTRTEQLTGSRNLAQFTNQAPREALLRQFGDDILPWNQLDGFADRLLGSFQDRSFEIAVGAQNESMRLALALKRDLASLAGQESSETTKWFTVLGTPSLRRVFETAFMLPSAFGAMDLDRQVEILQTRTARLTGDTSVSQFTDPEKVEGLIRRFFLSEQVGQIMSASANGNAALMLLQQGQASLKGLLGR